MPTTQMQIEATTKKSNTQVVEYKYPELLRLAKEWGVAYYILINAIRT